MTVPHATAHRIATNIREHDGQPNDPGWRRFARCVQDQKPVSWFFPDRSEAVGRRKPVKLYCGACPVKVMCLAVTMCQESLGTLPTSNRHGYAGTLSGAERERLAAAWGPSW